MTIVLTKRVKQSFPCHDVLIKGIFLQSTKKATSQRLGYHTHKLKVFGQTSRKRMKKVFLVRLPSLNICDKNLRSGHGSADERRKRDERVKQRKKEENIVFWSFLGVGLGWTMSCHCKIRPHTIHNLPICCN